MLTGASYWLFLVPAAATGLRSTYWLIIVFPAVPLFHSLELDHRANAGNLVVSVPLLAVSQFRTGSSRLHATAGHRLFSSLRAVTSCDECVRLTPSGSTVTWTGPDSDRRPLSPPLFYAPAHPASCCHHAAEPSPPCFQLSLKCRGILFVLTFPDRAVGLVLIHCGVSRAVKRLKI